MKEEEQARRIYMLMQLDLARWIVKHRPPPQLLERNDIAAPNESAQ